DALLFDDEASARHLYELGALIQPGADDGSRALAAALSEAPQLHARNPLEQAVGRVIMRYIDGMTWALNGDELATDLGIRHRAWRHAIHVSRLMIRPMEGLRRSVPFGSQVFAAWGNRAMHHGIAVQLRGLDADFKPPVRLPSVSPPSAVRAA
ncbi:MAG: hypothetical protein KC766_22450, partial [Myxococcales bacterium]|nr:hypothetical protein [Myxococcales bacterium]